VNFDVRNRKWHGTIAVVVALPFLLVILTGLLLQLKKQLTWVQPTEMRAPFSERVDAEALLDALRRDPTLNVKGWGDVIRFDVRPSRGVAKFTLSGDREAQVSIKDAVVLQVAPRRSDWIESLHDGSFFGGDVGKLYVFFPMGVLVLLLWASGVRLAMLPALMRRRKRIKDPPRT